MVKAPLRSVIQSHELTPTAWSTMSKRDEGGAAAEGPLAGLRLPTHERHPILAACTERLSSDEKEESTAEAAAGETAPPCQRG